MANPKLLAIQIKNSLTHSDENYNRTYLGKRLFAWYKETSGKLDYSLKHMYVVKHDYTDATGKHRRGEKLFKEPTGAYRDIYFYNEETRKALKMLIPIFDRPAANQIGFTANRGIWSLKPDQFKESNTRVKLDFKDAFNSITREQIFWILRIVFDLNAQASNELATKWTTNGHMLQGHPLAPLIFNLVTRPGNELVSKHIGFVQYADDSMVFSKNDYVSWGLLKWIFRVFKDAGFELNTEKEAFFHKNADTKFIGLEWNKGGIKSTRRKVFKGRMRMTNHLITMNMGKLVGYKTSNAQKKELSKELTTLLAKYEGYRNWRNYDIQRIKEKNSVSCEPKQICFSEIIS